VDVASAIREPGHGEFAVPPSAGLSWIKAYALCLSPATFLDPSEGINRGTMKPKSWIGAFSRPLSATLFVLTVAIMTPSAVAQAGDSSTGWLSCPDAASVDLRRNPDREPNRVREIAPSAGAKTSDELYGHARFAGLAYDLYAAFEGGQDPRTAFSHPDLQLVALIFGDPGPNTERRPRPKSSRTLYGFVADETATGRRYVVFRGTQQPAEWARNLQVGQRPYPAGTGARTAIAHVHAGFLEIFESLQLDAGSGSTPFAAALPDLVARHNTVFVGHSLGSALATLAGVEASRLSPERAPQLRIVTLASPRVGDAGFATLARAVGSIDRVCNLVDIVTAVPPSIRGLTYVHVGTPFRVSSFDWSGLVNDLAKAGDQILCWHGHQSYSLMLMPAHQRREPAQCFRSGN
jgi:Lipase (class 3)